MTGKPDNVRLAEPRDENALYALLLDLRLQSRDLTLLPPSPKKIIETIKEGTEQRGMIIGVIDGPNDTIVASVGLVVMAPWWSDTAMLMQRWLYSRPGAPGLSNSLLPQGLSDSLLRFSEWAREQMSDGLMAPMYLESSHTWGSRIAARDRLFARYGRRVGSVFLSP